MFEVADVVRLHGRAFRQQFGHCLTAAQKRALHDIQNCRTPVFGGHVYQCDHCRQRVFAYHSCGNRSCPKCHRSQTERWLRKQRARLLPCPYFLLTFTLPEELRPLARSHPKTIYGLLMKTAAAALKKLIRDPRYLGARVGVLSVLHTWTRAMLFHPHVHMLVTAGGLSPDGSRWVQPRHARFLVPVQALSVIFRAKFRDGLKKAKLTDGLPPSLWTKNWVVHCQHAGRGEKVLEYLGRYVFRIAIANSRIESVNDHGVRFHYRDNETRRIRHVSLTGIDFLGRFLQHVLPRNAVKVRHYGLFSPSHHISLDMARRILAAPAWPAPPADSVDKPPLPACPYCRRGSLVPIQTLPAHRNHPP